MPNYLNLPEFPSTLIDPSILRWVANRLPSRFGGLLRLGRLPFSARGIDCPSLRTLASWPSRPKPMDWIVPSEVQITRGWAYFLSEGGSRVSIARVEAFIRSISDCGYPDPKSGADEAIKVSRVLLVVAELPTAEGGRLDLVVRAVVDNVEMALIIEAKVGAVLCDGQLAAYSLEMDRLVKEWQISVCQGVLLVASAAQSDMTALTSEWNFNPARSWRLVRWRDLLAQYAKLLHDSHDSDDFSRFRSLVWESTYG